MVKAEVKPKPIGVFCDLDHTLIPFNSGVRWIWYMCLGRLMPLRFYLAGLVYFLPYVLGIISFDRFMKPLFRTLVHRPTKRFLRQTHKRFFPSAEIFPEFVQLIAWHKEQGHRLYVVTQSYDVVASLYSDYLNMNCLSTEVEEKKGRFTGKIYTLMHKDKAAIVDAVCRTEGLDCARSYAYADSVSDRGMLQAVGKGVLVSDKHRTITGVPTIRRKDLYKFITLMK